MGYSGGCLWLSGGDAASRLFHLGPAPPLEAKRVSEAVAARADCDGSISIECFLNVVSDLQAAPVPPLRRCRQWPRRKPSCQLRDSVPLTRRRT